MDKLKLCIKDTLFSHAFSSSNWFKPTYFEWNFNDDNCETIYLTDDYVDKVLSFNNKNIKLGSFKDLESAKKAYNNKSLEIYGKDAFLHSL